MQLKTTRFGSISIEPDDALSFGQGLAGFEDCHRWVLLADAQNSALGWLQCLTRPEIALAVVSPRRFVPDYQFRVYRSELAPLHLDRVEDAQVLSVVGWNGAELTLNLKAPIVVNVPLRLARQVIANGDQPLQHVLGESQKKLRKSA